MSIFVSAVYAGGLMQSRQLGKDWIVALLWPLALGKALAKFSSKYDV